MRKQRKVRIVMARPHAPLLNRGKIVDAALGLIDEEGLAALSTRRLAGRLGVSGPSLYNHFATMDDLLEAVADLVISQVDLSALDERDLPWHEALRRWARSYRGALAAHPNLIQVAVHGPGRRPAALRMAPTPSTARPCARAGAGGRRRRSAP